MNFGHRALEAVFSMAVARMIEDHRIGSHATGRPAFSNEKLESEAGLLLMYDSRKPLRVSNKAYSAVSHA